MTEGIYFLIGIILAAYFFLVALSPVVAYIAWSLWRWLNDIRIDDYDFETGPFMRFISILPIYKGLLKRFRGFHVDALFGFFGIGLALFMAWPIAILVGLAFGLRGCIRAKKAIRALTASIKKNLDSRD